MWAVAQNLGICLLLVTALQPAHGRALYKRNKHQALRAAHHSSEGDDIANHLSDRHGHLITAAVASPEAADGPISAVAALREAKVEARGQGIPLRDGALSSLREDTARAVSGAQQSGNSDRMQQLARASDEAATGGLVSAHGDPALERTLPLDSEVAGTGSTSSGASSSASTLTDVGQHAKQHGSKIFGKHGSQPSSSPGLEDDRDEDEDISPFTGGRHNAKQQKDGQVAAQMQAAAAEMDLEQLALARQKGLLTKEQLKAAVVPVDKGLLGALDPEASTMASSLNRR